jgi:chromosome segregation ATPase
MPKPWLILHYLKLAVVCALLLALAGVGVQAILLLHAATVATRALPGAVSAELQATRTALVTEFRSTRGELLAAVNSQADAAQAKVDRALSILDRRTGDALARVDAAITATNTAIAAANAQLSSANGTLAGIREDMKPAMQETQATVKDLHDSWDDLYWDVKASVESATVAARGVAEASEAAGKAAPKLADAAVKNGDNIAGITADVHTATSAFVKPKSTWQKIKSALWLIAYGAAHAM